jgi:hypothetical protein
LLLKENRKRKEWQKNTSRPFLLLSSSQSQFCDI